MFFKELIGTEQSLGNFYQIRLRCKSLQWPPVSGGRRPFGAGLNGRCSPHQPLRPMLKLPTQSEIPNGNFKVSNLKVCVQNAKLFLTQTLEHF